MAELEVISGNAVQAFCPDAEKSQVTSAMTGTKVFKKGTGADVNIVNWLVMQVRPTIDSVYYFNNDSTKTYTLSGGMDNFIFVASPSITQVTIAFGAGTAQIQGM